MKNTNLLILAFLVIAGPANAAVWRVERDGSGDFSVIQEAVDAAETGDTILLGPGRFSATSDFRYYNARNIQTCIALDKSLTIKGAGQAQSFVGPDLGIKTEYGTGGLACRTVGVELKLEDLTFIDCDGNSVLFDVGLGGLLEMDRVNIENTFRGVSIHGTTGSYIRDCSLFASSKGITLYRTIGLEINNCIIQNVAGTCVNIQFPESFGNRIVDCNISGGYTGIYLANCGVTSIENCMITDTFNSGLLIDNATGVSIENVVVSGDVGVGIDLFRYDDLTVRNSIFSGSYAAILVAHPASGMVFENNHILPTPGAWWVWVSSHYHGDPAIVDFANNYWGTINPEEISLGIYDGNDDDSRHIFIDFEPMADGPVSTEAATFEGFKAMFR